MSLKGVISKQISSTIIGAIFIILEDRKKKSGTYLKMQRKKLDDLYFKALK